MGVAAWVALMATNLVMLTVRLAPWLARTPQGKYIPGYGLKLAPSLTVWLKGFLKTPLFGWTLGKWLGTIGTVATIVPMITDTLYNAADNNALEGPSGLGGLFDGFGGFITLSVLNPERVGVYIRNRRMGVMTHDAARTWFFTLGANERAKVRLVDA